MSQKMNYYIAQDLENLIDIPSSKFVGDIPIQQIKDSMSKDELKVFKENIANEKYEYTKHIVFITKDRTLNLDTEIYKKCKSKKWNAKKIFDHFADSEIDSNGVSNVFPTLKYSGKKFLGILAFIIALILGGYYFYALAALPVDKTLTVFEIQNVKVDDYVEVKQSIFMEALGVVSSNKALGVTVSKTNEETYFLMMDTSGETYAVKFEKGSKVGAKIISDFESKEAALETKNKPDTSEDEEYDGEYVDLFSQESFKGVVRDLKKFPNVAGKNLDKEFTKDVSLMNLQTGNKLGFKEPKYLIDTTIEPISRIYKTTVFYSSIVILISSIIFLIVNSIQKAKYIENLLKIRSI